jgi:hypothetical protein
MDSKGWIFKELRRLFNNRQKDLSKPCLLENPKTEISVSEGVGYFSATTHTLLVSSIIIVRDSTLQKVSD